MSNLYDKLGIKKDASQKEIKNAYRKKSLEKHPDHGGCPKEFDSINKAYRILISEEDRSKYDAGANAEDILAAKKPQQQKSLQILAQVFGNIVLGADVKTTNIVKSIKDQIENAIAEVEKAVKTERLKKEKFEVVLKRLKYSKKENFLKEIAKSQIAGIEKNIKQGEEAKKDLVEALYFLDGYSYEIDEIMMVSSPLTSIPTGSFFFAT